MTALAPGIAASSSLTNLDAELKVCVFVCVCVRACRCAYVRMCVCACVCMWFRLQAGVDVPALCQDSTIDPIARLV